MNKTDIHVDLQEPTIGTDHEETMIVRAYKFGIKINPLVLYSKEDLPREIRVDLVDGRIRVRVYDGLTQEPTTILLGE